MVVQTSLATTINIIVVAKDIMHKGQYYIVSTSGIELVLPETNIDNTESSIRLQVNNLFNDTCHVDAVWANLQPLGTYIINDTIKIFYGALIPHDTPLKNGFWCGMDSITDNAIREMMSHAIRMS